MQTPYHGKDAYCMHARVGSKQASGRVSVGAFKEGLLVKLSLATKNVFKNNRTRTNTQVPHGGSRYAQDE